MAIVDKRCNQQVLGCLIKHPQYLSETDKYHLAPTDFSSTLEKYIFAAVYNLFFNGAPNISIVDISNYIDTNGAARTVFDNEKGLDYLQDIEDYSNEENFPYYYNRLKKINMLNEYKKLGVDISDFYKENSLDPDAVEVNAKFETLEISDIANAIKKKILKIETNYVKTAEVQSWNLADEIDDVIEDFGNADAIGLQIQGEIYSRVINGAERGALTIRSAPSGVGKTRLAVADACYLAFPIRYNINTEKWEQKGSNEHILFIMTEQKPEQIMKMIVAYISDVNESKFKYGQFTDEEKDRIAKAVQIIKKYSDNFKMIRIPNPTIELLKCMVRDNCLTTDISCVFYDYIFIGPALLNEFRGFNIRNDEALLMFATALKDLAIELNVAVFTSTQVNAKSDDNKDIRNEASLAGGRSTINKADNGAIMARPTKDEIELLQKLIKTIEPNLVTDIYKVRSGQWTQVRIWSYFNGGTMRREDLFITDSRLESIKDFYDGFTYSVEIWAEDAMSAVNNLITEFNK